MADKQKELPVDKSPANFGQSDRDANAALREQNLEAAENVNLTFEHANDDEPTVARVSAGVPINPSSTYPGRDKELAENDGRIPTALDLAKRAAFAGTQVPAIVEESGWDVEDFKGSFDEDTKESDKDEDKTEDNA